MEKRFLKFIFLLPIPLIIILFNLTFDPAHLFDNGKYEQGMAIYLLQNKNLGNVANYDVRLLEKYYIRGLTARKDIIVLGSSRSLTVKQELFPNSTFFNNSVPGASIEDYRYVYNLYNEKKLLPQKIIIGLDPWILNENKYSGIESNKKNFVARIRNIIITRTNLDLDTITKQYQLISPSYFQSSFSSFLKSLKRDTQYNRYQVIDNPQDPKIEKYADGSMNLSTSFGDDMQKANRLALTFDPVPLLGGFDTLDLKSESSLEALVEQMQQGGSEVVFYLPPYHPITYKNLVDSVKYKIIADAQGYFVNLAKSKGIVVIGSYNPADYQLDESDFYDGSHPREKAVTKILRFNLSANF